MSSKADRDDALSIPKHGIPYPPTSCQTDWLIRLDGRELERYADHPGAVGIQPLDEGYTGHSRNYPSYLSIVLFHFDIGSIFGAFFKDSLFEFALVCVGLDNREIFIIIHNKQK